MGAKGDEETVADAIFEADDAETPRDVAEAEAAADEECRCGVVEEAAAAWRDDEDADGGRNPLETEEEEGEASR